MSDLDSTVAKLQIVKELANEKSVQQVCDILIDYISEGGKGKLGFVQSTEDGDAN